MPDFYEVLQVHPSAEPEVIRAAYRILARKYHPDHGGDARRMMALNDAWDVLGDVARRAEYDASRAARASRQAPATSAAATAAAGAAQPASADRPSERSARSEPWAAGSSGAGGASDATHAGPPPGRPSGTVLDFGRYAGWSLGEIARYDMDYLQWLQRATFGRRLRVEIDALVRQRFGPASPGPTSSEAWKGRR